jgi:hypothetical protein
MARTWERLVIRVEIYCGVVEHYVIDIRARIK